MIVLVRHGEAENAGGRAIGQTDLPLSAAGERQARTLADSLCCIDYKSFYASPLTRTMQTASYIDQKCAIPPIPCPELQEINLGKWDGLSFKKIKKDFPEQYRMRGKDIAGFRPPGGENFLDLKDRVSEAINRISSEDTPAVIVTHAGVIRIVMHLILNFPLENIFKIKPTHCYASIVSKTSHGLTLKAFNIPPGTALSNMLRQEVPQPDQF
ncbi:histidine phosphatase family protein [Maridesulfovibrio hydrothermalis]|uniref:Phosphoglycerate mutase n=1 Tax=Maridesulfovibrio hydrothermalis AM13 = DSM 14728 TaxID=1121451 RepID=L0R966_9BACT|nr:histidine phosphatase family protein [Maridesulfovibrio hydrothermalis]CCO22730.1 Phosphoglycerate mutase [Maridesulfovibrio hydrothermalis AM13 = DSM 14728]